MSGMSMIFRIRIIIIKEESLERVYRGEVNFLRDSKVRNYRN